jgi:methylated-DNA-[protein]-cysteine S-methyltransferase
MAKNPVPLIIPCHRVLAAGGKIGGFSAPSGSAAKIRMLELEGVYVERPRPAQQADDAPLLRWRTTTQQPKT